MKEANNTCATFQSYNALFPCHSCLVSRENLSSVNHELIFPLRITENIKNFMNNLSQADLSQAGI